MIYSPANARSFEISENIPEVIWHYTSFNSVKKIIESCSMHATCCFDFKDKKEIRLGLDLVLQHLEQKKSTNDYIPTIQARLKQYFDDTSEVGFGIISFTDKYNSQYHWDNYGKNVQSPHCSMGFNSHALVKAFSNLSFEEINNLSLPNRIWFSDLLPSPAIQFVVYNLQQNLNAINNEISKRVSNIIDERLRLIKDGMKDADKLSEKNIIDQLRPIVLYTKSSKFKQDSEVRLTFSAPFKIKRKKDKEIRYIKASIHPTFFPVFLTEIIIDSDTDFEKYKEELQETCKTAGINYNNLKITQRSH